MSTGTSRRAVLLTAVGGAAAAALPWTWLARSAQARSAEALRPPGALDEPDFLARCIRCGQCAVDCPPGILRMAGPGDPAPLGTPYFVARTGPCQLCDDLPCVAACPTGALDPALEDPADADMGVAVLVDPDTCLAFRGLRCEICYRDCPLQERAIRIRTLRRGTSLHARFVPVVVPDACTGCGMCEKACPLEEPAIRVLPRSLGQGRLGAHYAGFMEDGHVREGAGYVAPLEEDTRSALEYLNDGELP